MTNPINPFVENTMTAPTPTLTFFDRSAMPVNLLTVPEWRRFSKHAASWISDYKVRGPSWERAARAWAYEHGGALVMLANDDLVTFTVCRHNGSLRKKTFKRSKWAWDSNVS